MNKRTVIVVGAGPAGLAAALELATAGHSVTVLESDSHYNVWQVNGDAEYQEEFTEEKGRQVPLPLSMSK